MKFYSKTIFIIAALFAVAMVKAQNMPLDVGVKAGFNVSDLDANFDTDFKLGFLIGATVDYSFNANWLLMSGVELTSKGADIDDYGWDGKINAVYIQTPVHIGYKFNIAKGIKIVPHAGTYFAFGVAGKTKINGSKQNTFGNVMDRFDVGIGTGAGIEFREFFFDLSYDYGILDAGRKGLDIQNETLYLTAAYKF